MLEGLKQKLAALEKRERFMVIIAGILVLGVFLSVITKVSFISEDEDSLYRIAVVGPITGDSAAIGRSIRQGAELYVSIANAAGGIGETRLAIDVYDDKNTAEGAKQAAAKIVADKRVRAVVGHWASPAARAAAEVYRENGIPAMTVASVDPAVTKDNEWLFSTVFNDREQARFLANYARNVLGHKLVTVIADSRAYGASMAENFAATYLRFGTKVRYTYAFDSAQPVVPQMQQIVADLKPKKDAGVIFLAVNEIDGARLLKLIRDAGIRNQIIGPNGLATAAFNKAVGELPGKRDDPGRYTNNMLVTAPLLFDTANETAQNFRARYLAKFGNRPDWVAAYAYDAVQLMVRGLRSALGNQEVAKSMTASRQTTRDFLAGASSLDDALPGITGVTYFNDAGEARKPVLIGVYNGSDVISALTQLQPIRTTGVQNYIEELKQGKVLYVNDRFMYKTNVVYTGIQVGKISDFDLKKNEFTMDFVIWFRYRGKFEPQDLVFINAVEPIVLDKPADEKLIGDLIYRLYRIKAKFRFNFSAAERPYGQHVVGVGFSNRLLNKNNLQYVVDVLGVGLNQGETVRDKLEKVQAINPASGWVPVRAWLSQDIVGKQTHGDPAYVGYASTDPDFSQIIFGAVIKRDVFSARDFIPGEFFIYIGIFALIGSLTAFAMDHRERGRFWAAQSWFIRVASWPLLLLAAGNLLLDFAFLNLSDYYIDTIILVYETLWWLIPARLMGVALERFLWLPLEDHTERNIPNVIRVFASVTIYSFAVCGAIAFVFDQTLTSILASTGLLAMIIGLAVQSNISNIFSGIVINMERPFNVGDWVQIGDMDEGRVIDITWRTVRIKVRNGYIVSLPNGQVSEAQIHNFSSFNSVRLEMPLFLEAKYPFEETAEIMERGLAKAPRIMETPGREVRFKGVQRALGSWIAEYEIQFWIENYGPREEISENALTCVWNELINNDVLPSDQMVRVQSSPPLLEGEAVASDRQDDVAALNRPAEEPAAD